MDVPYPRKHKLKIDITTATDFLTESPAASIQYALTKSSV